MKHPFLQSAKLFVTTLFSAGLLLCSATLSHAQLGFYVTGYGGLSLQEDAGVEAFGSPGFEFEFDKGWLAGGAIGSDSGLFRTEFEVAYRKNTFDQANDPIFGPTNILGADISAVSYMLNLYMDLENPTPLTPYIGGGAGAATIFVDDDFGPNDDDTVFAWKAAAGVLMSLAPNLGLQVEYNYFEAVDPELFDTQWEYRSHSISGGIRLQF